LQWNFSCTYVLYACIHRCMQQHAACPSESVCFRNMTYIPIYREDYIIRFTNSNSIKYLTNRPIPTQSIKKQKSNTYVGKCRQFLKIPIWINFFSFGNSLWLFFKYVLRVLSTVLKYYIKLWDFARLQKYAKIFYLCRLFLLRNYRYVYLRKKNIFYRLSSLVFNGWDNVLKSVKTCQKLLEILVLGNIVVW
jgi:hypothetical protein